MEATTIKVQPKTKHLLDDIKEERETYDDVISRIARQTKKKLLLKELAEGYQVQAERDKAITEEWDVTLGDGNNE